MRLSGPADRLWRRRGGSRRGSSGSRGFVIDSTVAEQDQERDQSSEPVGTLDRWRAHAVRLARRATSRRSHLWPAVTLAVWTVAVWARPVLRDFAHLRLSNPGDSESFAFYLSWNVHALTNGLDPFFTQNLYAPDGLDLGNAISVPSVSLLVSPVTAALGGTAGYNTAFLLAIFFGGMAVYLLARELFGSVVGATIAGGLMVVSPYFTGHALSHLNLMWVFGLPFLAYLVARAVGGRLRRRWLVALTALTVAFTVGASTELLVTESVFALVALGLVIAFATPSVRARVLATVPFLGIGAVLGVALASPVIVAALRSGVPSTVANDPTLYSTDLTNLVAPTELTLVGDTFFMVLRQRWLGNAAENTAYLPLTLVVLVVMALAVRRRRPASMIAAFALVSLVFSFGPLLTIAGVHTVPMPWSVTQQVPGLDHALPGRFSAFVFMAVALLVADVWSTRALPRWLVGALAASTCVLLLPNLNQMAFPVDASVPAFVTDGGLADEISAGENVLVLPAGQWGPGMRWMDELDFAFEMPIGNGGGAQAPAALEDPTARALYDRDLTFDYDSTLRRFLDDNDVSLVVVDTRDPRWKALMDDALDQPAQAEEGLWIYDIG